MLKHRRLRIVWVSFAVVVCAAAIVYGINLYDESTLPSRITSAAKDHVVNKSIFTEAKLIEYHEDSPINLNGDETLEGVFQLSKEDMKTLLSPKTLLVCQATENCTVEQTTYTPAGANTSADSPGGTLYNLDIDTVKNQATWTITLY